MRSFLLVLTLAALLPSPAAEACGSYLVDRSPQLLVVEVPTVGGQDFVLLGGTIDSTSTTWTRINSRTYDHTVTAPAPAFPVAVDVTLLGPGGTQAVTTTRKVLVAHGSRMSAPAAAIPVPKGKRAFAVAVIGDASQAEWLPLASREVELVTTYDANARSEVTRVRVGTQDHGRAAGRPLGIYRDQTGDYVALRDGNRITTVKI